jgi:beta-glucanase (GH16 family)
MTASFWLQEPSTEIDIQEALAVSSIHGRERLLTSTVHWFPPGTQNDHFRAKHRMMRTPVTAWHTYGAWWRGDRSVWIYLDGKKAFELEPPTAFRRRMYLFLDTEPFEKEGLPSSQMLADRAHTEMQVDWVRSYRLAR